MTRIWTRIYGKIIKRTFLLFICLVVALSLLRLPLYNPGWETIRVNVIEPPTIAMAESKRSIIPHSSLWYALRDVIGHMTYLRNRTNGYHIVLLGDADVLLRYIISKDTTSHVPPQKHPISLTVGNFLQNRSSDGRLPNWSLFNRHMVTEIIWTENYWLFRKDSDFHAMLPFKYERLRWPQKNLTILLPTDVPNYLESLESSRFIPCNRTRASQFRDKHPPGFLRRILGPKLKPQHLNGSFYALDLLQHSYGLQPFICMGTLLGWYRECGIIQHTNDFDLCLKEEAFSAQLYGKLLTNERLQLRYAFGERRDSLELTFFPNGAHVDLFLVYKEGNRTYMPSVDWWDFHKWRFYFNTQFTKMCTGDLLGRLVRVPCDTESFLIDHYGTGWFDPTNYAGKRWDRIPHGRIADPNPIPPDAYERMLNAQLHRRVLDDA